MDEVGDVLIRKPASAGMEDRPGVILQAHMDMVPEKAPGKVHDFETDPITAFVEEGWVRTDGTTLGADDGIGVALIMALLEDETIAHGPLEALFTVNEEDGFTGADAVQPGVLQGSLLINVDSEVEGTFTIGSAGGADVDVTATYAEEPTPAGLTGMRLEITGLQGGHSGIDINRGRGNAIKLLARLLWSARQEIAVRVASIEGGGRYNAIPREAAAVVAVPEAEATRLTGASRRSPQRSRQELARTEPDLQIAATPAEIPDMVMTPDAQRRIVGALYGCPNGVMRMSDSVPGLVETSTNLGVWPRRRTARSPRASWCAARSTPRATTSNRWPASVFDAGWVRSGAQGRVHGLETEPGLAAPRPHAVGLSRPVGPRRRGRGRARRSRNERVRRHRTRDWT